MKTITPPFIRFTILAIFLTIGFRILLSYGIGHQNHLCIITASAVYGLGMFTLGWHFGKKDAEYLPIQDLGFRFHLVTFLIHHSVSYVWLLLGFGSRYESLRVLHITLLIWLPLLAVHFIFFLANRKHTINHLDKEDIFD